MTGNKDVQWIDSGREPKVAPNPAYPHGIDLDMSKGRNPSCLIELPYPAKRVGYYAIKCNNCGWTGVITTAGRPDDPRSVRVLCKRSVQ
jgi:hypothetical protein